MRKSARFRANGWEFSRNLPGKCVGLILATASLAQKNDSGKAAGIRVAYSAAMIKLNSGFSEYSADGLAHLGETVGKNLLSIAILSTLKPTSAQITAAAAALRTAIALPPGSGRTQSIEATFDTLAKLLGDVATNAPQISGVTDADLAAIGLKISKAPTRSTTTPAACLNLVLRHGENQGEVQGKCDPNEGNIRTYEGQWALDPNGNGWSELETFPNSRSFKFTGLTRGKDTWFRVRARNTIGAGAWSDPAVIMVT